MMALSPTTIKGDFLRRVVATSKNRVVRGRATLVLAEYLRMESTLAEFFQSTGLPASFDALLAAEPDDDLRKKVTADPAAHRRGMETLYGQYQADYFQVLKQADFAALRRESDRMFDRALAEFADVPAPPRFGRPTRETIADVARQQRSPTARPVTPEGRVKPIAEAYKAAEKKAQDASNAAGPGEAGVKAYIAAAPKWADYGPRMWAIAEANPRSPDGFAALIWIVGHHIPFFDAAEERSAMLGRAVDLLIADHLDYLGDHAADRDVLEGFNRWSPVPNPHTERIFRALFERGRTRDIRGAMGLGLARLRKAEADLAESFEVRGSDPALRYEIPLFAPSYLDALRKAGHQRLAEEAATTFEKVKAGYGDVADVNGVGPTGETLATVVDRELADLRTLAVGQLAPEIVGKDVEGRPMALSEFRGKVVVLDFGTHEHCGACQLVYPRQKELVDAYQARPFAMLGVNFGDHLDVLKGLRAKKDVTWRCWWDGDDFLHPGPITSRWNIKMYPTFYVLDHRGVIRFKDLNPLDPTFGPAIEALIRAAEAGRR